MRTPFSLLLLAAQFRPLVGVLFCLFAAPPGAPAMAECDEPGMTDHRAAPAGPRWEVAGGGQEGCSLAVACRPLTSGIVAPALVAPESQRPQAVPATRPVSWASPAPVAPPTPPPNL